MNTRFRSYLACMVPMMACLALQNMAMVFGAQVYLVVMFFRLEPGAYEDFTNRFMDGLTSHAYVMGVSLGYAVVGVVLFYFWYRAMKRQEEQLNIWPGRDRGRNRDSLRGYPLYLYAGILLFAIGAQYVCANIMVILAHARPDWMESYTRLIEALDLSGNGWDILTLLYTVLVGPVCEELCFRGLTMNYSRQVMRPYLANTVQALFFGGLHANPLQSIYAFVFGWILGLVYLETDNLWICMLGHITFNGLAMVLGDYIGVGASPVSFYCILLISMMAVYSGYLLIQKAQRQKTQQNMEG